MHNQIASPVIFALTLAMARIALAQAAPPAPPSEPKAVCEKALEHVLKEEYLESLTFLRAMAFNPPSEASWQHFVEGMQTQFVQARGKYGEPLGWELAQECCVNQTLRRYVYLFKYDTGVVCWQFVLYRPRDVWRIRSWSMAENLDPVWSCCNSRQQQSPAAQEAH